jgi:hypothetical protein
MIHQAAVRARAARRCFLRGEYVDMTPGRERTSQEGKRRRYLCVWDNALPGAARGWHVQRCAPLLKGPVTREACMSQRRRRLLWFFGIHALPSFLFRKLLGTTLQKGGQWPFDARVCIARFANHRAPDTWKIRGNPREAAFIASGHM